MIQTQEIYMGKYTQILFSACEKNVLFFSQVLNEIVGRTSPRVFEEIKDIMEIKNGD